MAFWPLFRYYGYRMLIFTLGGLTLGAIILGAYLTNPFNRYTIVRRAYRAEMVDGTLRAIDENAKLTVNQRLPLRIFAVLKNGVHIMSSRWHKSPASQATDLRGIIEDIYDLRFNPGKLLLTSGDHFSALFVRNLGVFYYPTLDRSIPATERHGQFGRFPEHHVIVERTGPLSDILCPRHGDMTAYQPGRLVEDSRSVTHIMIGQIFTISRE